MSTNKYYFRLEIHISKFINRSGFLYVVTFKCSYENSLHPNSLIHSLYICLRGVNWWVILYSTYNFIFMFLLFSGLNRQLLTARHSSCVIFLLYLFFLYFSQYNMFPPNCGLLFLSGYSVHLHNGIVTNHFMLYRALQFKPVTNYWASYNYNYNFYNYNYNIFYNFYYIQGVPYHHITFTYCQGHIRW